MARIDPGAPPSSEGGAPGGGGEEGLGELLRRLEERGEELRRRSGPPGPAKRRRGANEGFFSTLRRGLEAVDAMLERGMVEEARAALRELALRLPPDVFIERVISMTRLAVPGSVPLLAAAKVAGGVLVFALRGAAGVVNMRSVFGDWIRMPGRWRFFTRKRQRFYFFATPAEEGEGGVLKAGEAILMAASGSHPAFAWSNVARAVIEAGSCFVIDRLLVGPGFEAVREKGAAVRALLELAAALGGGGGRVSLYLHRDELELARRLLSEAGLRWRERVGGAYRHVVVELA